MGASDNIYRAEMREPINIRQLPWCILLNFILGFTNAAENIKTWTSSQTSPAVFKTYGGDYRHDFSESNIAKGKTWISSNSWSPRGVTVTFDSTVTITSFLVTARTDCCTNRYSNVGLFVDGSSAATAMTPDLYNPGHAPFDMLKFKTGESLKGREFKLDWIVSKDSSGEPQFAQVSFLEIKYIAEEDLFCSKLTSKNEQIWVPGCPAASMQVNGGSHAAFPPANLNRDPDTFWHSAYGNGGVLLKFNKKVVFTSVIIGARKRMEDWNHQRYQNVEVLVDGKVITKTCSSCRIPDDFVISIPISAHGTSLGLKWPNQVAQIATLEVLYTDVPPAEWSNWSEWSECSVSCGDGILKRTRKCVGGNDCKGDDFEKKPCNIKTCTEDTVCTQLNSENERTWTTGCPEASLKINGGSHQYFPQSNLNRDPDTFWHSLSGGGGGVVLTFKKEVAFKEVRIGARKETADWNHERYRNVEVLIDGKFITKTNGFNRIPENFIIPIKISGVKGKTLELKWPKVSVQIATFEVLYKEEVWTCPESHPFAYEDGTMCCGEQPVDEMTCDGEILDSGCPPRVPSLLCDDHPKAKRESCEKYKRIFKFDAQDKEFKKTDEPEEEVNGVKLTMRQFKSMRTYAAGYIHVGGWAPKASATISQLAPNAIYEIEISSYCGAACPKESLIYLPNGKTFKQKVHKASLDPVFKGKFKSSPKGELPFGFNVAEGQHAKFSGLTVRKCSSGKPDPVKPVKPEKPKCAKRLSFSNFETGDSDLNGFWSHVIVDGKVKENEGYPIFQQEGLNKKAKPIMWWMWHGDVGHWVVNMTPGQHGNDRLKTALGKFGCAEKKTTWEGPAAAKNPNFKIDVAPPKCPEDACPGKKCVMKKNIQGIYKPVCETPARVWGDWGEWSGCSVSCGDGYAKKVRYCVGGTDCKNDEIIQDKETKPCKIKNCAGITGRWGSWSSYSPCSVTCGRGVRTRTRTCVQTINETIKNRKRRALGLLLGFGPPPVPKTPTCESDVSRRTGQLLFGEETMPCTEHCKENNPRYQCLGDKRHSGQLGWFGIWDGHRVLEQGWRTSDWIRNPRLGMFARRKTKTAEECADLCNLAGERKCHYFHWGDSKCATKLYGCPKTDCVFYSYFSKTHRIFKMTPRLNEYKKVGMRCNVMPYHWFQDNSHHRHWRGPYEGYMYKPQTNLDKACNQPDNPNGGCSDICRLDSMGLGRRECACPEGKKLIGNFKCSVGNPVVVKSKVQVNQPMTKELENPESEEFKELEKTVLAATSKSYEDTAAKHRAFFQSRVKAFSFVYSFGRRRRRDEKGAVVAEIETEFFSSEEELKVDEKTLETEVEKQLEKVKETILEESDPTKEFFNALAAEQEAGLAATYCPSTTCWTYSDGKCVLKTGTTAILDGCKLDLKCDPDLMDFRFKFDDLIGSENNVDHTTGGCPAKSTDGLTDIPTVQDTNFMWRYELGFCDSEVKRTTDENSNEWISVSKTISYSGSSDAIDVGHNIWLDEGAKVSVTFSCKFRSTFTTNSDEIEIISGEEIEGKLEEEGSWTEAFKLEYTDKDFITKKSTTYTGILGETFNIRASWTVFDKAIATKLNWYISDCTIKSLKNDDSEDGKKVQIIEDLCYAGVVNATPKSALVSKKEFTFEYRSFSFNKAGDGKQKIECDVKLCLLSECSSKTAPGSITCPVDTADAYKWVKAN